MKKFTFGFLFITFIAFAAVDGQRWNANGRKPQRTGSYYSEEVEGSKMAETGGLPKMERQAMKPPSRGGIGAWGYVSIILFVILTGLGVYYTIIFYPIVCKKQRMYHVMGSTTV